MSTVISESDDKRAPEKRTSKRVIQGQKTRQLIVRTAAHLFSKRGYEGVSQREIAEAAGITKALLYHHFDSKEQIYNEARSYFQEQFDRGAGSALAELGDNPSALMDWVEKQFAFYREHPEMARMILWGFMEGKPFDPLCSGELKRNAQSMFKQAVDKGVLNEEVNPGLARLMISSLMFSWFAMKGAYVNREDTTVDDEYFRQMTALIATGAGSKKLGKLRKKLLKQEK